MIFADEFTQTTAVIGIALLITFIVAAIDLLMQRKETERDEHEFAERALQNEQHRSSRWL